MKELYCNGFHNGLNSPPAGKKGLKLQNENRKGVLISDPLCPRLPQVARGQPPARAQTGHGANEEWNEHLIQIKSFQIEIYFDVAVKELRTAGTEGYAPTTLVRGRGVTRRGLLRAYGIERC